MFILLRDSNKKKMSLDKIRQPEVLLPSLAALGAAGAAAYFHQRLTTLEKKVDEIQQAQKHLQFEIAQKKAVNGEFAKKLEELDFAITNLGSKEEDPDYETLAEGYRKKKKLAPSQPSRIAVSTSPHV